MKVYKIKVNGKIYEVEVEVLEKEEFVSNDNSKDTLTLDLEISMGLIKSPVQGKILSLNVNEGDKVSKGDVLLIIEAVEMKNEIIADTSGVVESILVTKGKQVDREEILLIIK